MLTLTLSVMDMACGTSLGKAISKELMASQRETHLDDNQPQLMLGFVLFITALNAFGKLYITSTHGRLFGLTNADG